MASAGSSKAGRAPSKNAAFGQTPRMRIPRNYFDLSHRRLMPADFGQLIPSLCLEVIPGDTFELGNHVMAHLQAMYAPVLDSAFIEFLYFFVPNRLTWPKVDEESGDDWETFRTRGVQGTNSAVVPRWNVSPGVHSKGSLWDYFGLPTWDANNFFATQFPDAIIPLDLPKRAYNKICNDWFLDETANTMLDITASEVVIRSSWAKDYFTSALPFAQRGISPALPLSGLGSAVFDGNVPLLWPAVSTSGFSGQPIEYNDDTDRHPRNVNSKYALELGVASKAAVGLEPGLDDNVVDMSSVAAGNMQQLRINIVLQQLLERNATGGIRYTEFLQHEFNVDPEDYRLQRSEFIGSYRQPVIFSEVVQTSAVDSEPTPLGNKAGHGISVNQGYVGKYTCKEEGYLIGIMRVMPVASYSQGIDKMWSRVSPYDFPLPAFAGLGEEMILNQEIMLLADGNNTDPFGFQARYNEMRFMRNSVHGIFRDELDYWHLGRRFTDRPSLDSTFINLTDEEAIELKRIFAVPSQPGFLVNVGNIVQAIRPLPAIATPGLSRV